MKRKSKNAIIPIMEEDQTFKLNEEDEMEIMSRRVPLAKNDKLQELLYTNVLASREKLEKLKTLGKVVSKKINVKEEYALKKSYQKVRDGIEMQGNEEENERIRHAEKEELMRQRIKYKEGYGRNQAATSGKPTTETAFEKQYRAKSDVERRYKSEKDKKIQRQIQLAFHSRKLDLKSLDLHEMPKQMFYTLVLQLLHCIDEVNLSDNSIRYIPESFCQLLYSIQTLNIRDNQISSLSNAFDKFQHITTCIADSNQLKELPMSLPESLKSLSLRSNRIVHCWQISQLAFLTALDLSKNQLQFLPAGLFLCCRLTTLNVSGNKLITAALLPKCIQPMATKIKLENQRLKALSNDKKDWIFTKDASSGVDVYFNKVTKVLRRRRPSILDQQDEIELVQNEMNDNLQESTTPNGVHIPMLTLNDAIPGLRVSALATAKESAHSTEVDSDEEEDPESTPSWIKWPGGWEIQHTESANTLNFYNHSSKTGTNSIPKCMELWHVFEELVLIKLNNNSITELPESIGSVKRLQQLEIEYNSLHSLPNSIGELKNLHTLLLGQNAIVALPSSFTNLLNLKRLNIRLNRLTTLPYHFGDLQQLQTLDLSCNFLVELPGSMMRLKNLAEIKLQSNPDLIMPSQKAIQAGISGIFFECRNKLKVEVRGAPPMPQKVDVGIDQECKTTDVNIQHDLTKLIQESQETNVLDYHWKQLSMDLLPSSIFSVSNLQELRLVGHELTEVPVGIAQLLELRILNLRQNKIKIVAPECFPVHSKMEEINLENNLIVSLPESISNLVELRFLTMTNNHLESVPDALGSMSKMEWCLLNHNHIKRITSSIAKQAKSLTLLDLSYNHIKSIDIEWKGLKNLRTLRLNLNKLRNLPGSLASISLNELQASGNDFHYLPMVLTKLFTLKSLWLRVNHIVQLPVDFGKMQQLEVIEFDGNPLRAPPAEIVREGIKSVKYYLDKRVERVAEVEKLFTDADIAYNPKQLLPKSINLISKNGNGFLRYLTEEDYIHFDTQIDKYLNKDFYLNNIRAVDVFESIIAKAFEQGQKRRRTVLDAFLVLCNLIKSMRWLDKRDINYKLDRPWGRNGQVVTCMAINPSALFEDTKQMPCIMTVIKARVQRGFKEEEFLYTRDEIADALEYYVGPYGPVGMVHNSIPFKCTCETLIKTGRMHKPCYRPGWIVKILLYTDVEAERRVDEEEKLAAAIERIRQELTTFMDTEAGLEKLKSEVREIRVDVANDIKLLNKEIPKLRRELGKLEQSLRNAKAKFALEKSAKGAAWTTAEENAGKRSIEEINQELMQKGAHHLVQNEKLVRLKIKRKQKLLAFKPDIVNRMMSEATVETREQFINDQRYRAIRRKLRRPWDGREGIDFIRFTLRSQRQNEEGMDIDEDEVIPPSKSNSEISDISALNAQRVDEDDDSSLDEDMESIESVSEVSSDNLSDVSDVSEDFEDEQSSENEDSEISL